MTKKNSGGLLTAMAVANSAVDKAKSSGVFNSMLDSELELLELDVSKIHPDPDQPRSQWTNEEKEDLRATILKTGGCTTPIKVRPHPLKMGEFMIVVGEGRHTIHTEENILKIKALLDVKDRDPADRFYEQIAENVGRRSMIVLDEAKAYQQFSRMFDPKLKQNELAKMFGKSNTHMSRLFGLLKAPAEVQALSDERVSQDINVLSYLRQLSTKVSKAKLSSIIDDVKKGNVTDRELQGMITSIKNKLEEASNTPGIKDDCDESTKSMTGQFVSEGGDLDDSITIQKGKTQSTISSDNKVADLQLSSRYASVDSYEAFGNEVVIYLDDENSTMLKIPKKELKQIVEACK